MTQWAIKWPPKLIWSKAVQRLDNRIDRAFDKLTARLNFTQRQIDILAALQIATLVKLFAK
jgi:hypothetical protein